MIPLVAWHATFFFGLISDAQWEAIDLETCGFEVRDHSFFQLGIRARAFVFNQLLKALIDFKWKPCGAH